MLNLYPTYVAWHYYLLVVVVALGIIQAAASEAGLIGLQIGGRIWPKKWAKGALVFFSIGGVFLFVYLTPDFISPGLAGAELIFVFGAGTITAFALSMIGATVLASHDPIAVVVNTGENHSVVSYLDSLELPDGEQKGMAILLADPDVSEEALRGIREQTKQADYACVTVSWKSKGLPRYPDVLAVVPMLIDRYERRIDGVPLVLVGCGLSGDLALRSAVEDDRVSGVVAITPALVPEAIGEGLVLLREMNFLQAWRWQRRWDRRRFVALIAGAETLGQLGSRARLVVSGEQGGCFAIPEMLLVEAMERGCTVEIAHGASHIEILRELSPRSVADELRRVCAAYAASSR